MMIETIVLQIFSRIGEAVPKKDPIQSFKKRDQGIKLTFLTEQDNTPFVVYPGYF